ncbi:MAG: MBL fold metallo-hydrolase [Spirochaetes bacterium]|jgi:glyoxylase-like metal-dependent hydrolase (beta-lactamase superfamily II)|nr:MBL fold metallo-hydrolase [Spirochaetota bacterium]
MMIIEQIEVTMMSVFCYLLCDEETREAALIDPAGDFDDIFEVVSRNGALVRYIINTHGHWDHTSGNAHAAKRTGATLLVHDADAEHARSVPNRILSLARGGGVSAGPVRLLHGGEAIPLGSRELKIIHTPGHTPGGICILADGNLFTGDTLFTEGMGRTDMPGGSYNDLMNSIQNIILRLPDATKIWPGHNYGRFPVSTVKEQKRYYT